MNEYERRLGEIRKRPRPAKPSLEQEAFLSSLGVNTLKWVNSQFRRHPELDDNEATLAEMWREAVRLNDLDRHGLLAGYWWQEHRPDWSKPAAE